MRGPRGTAVTNELAGERVDIVLYSENHANLLINPLAPAAAPHLRVDKARPPLGGAVAQEN